LSEDEAAFYWARGLATDFAPGWLPRIVEWVPILVRAGRKRMAEGFPPETAFPRFMAMQGGSRAGKSLAAAAEAMIFILYCSPGRTFLVGPTYGLCEKEFRYINLFYLSLGFQMVRRNYDVKSGALMFETPWGHVVEAKTCDNKDSLLGDEYDQILLCEGARIASGVWDRFLSVRTEMREAKVIYNTTAAGRNWGYQEFILPGRPGAKYDSDHFSIEVSLEDCPHFPQAALKKKREKMPPNVYAEQVLGQAVSYSGLVFPEFRQKSWRSRGHLESWSDVHERVGDEWKRWMCYEAIDPGIGAPTGALWCLVEPRDRLPPMLHFVQEMYERGMAAPVAAGAVLARREALGLEYPVEGTCGDPSAFRRDPSSGLSVAELYQDAGLVMFGADNDVDAGILAIKTAFHQDRIRIMDHLAETIRELETYEYKKYDPENWTETAKPVGGKFHLMDCTRYMLQSFPLSSAGHGFRVHRDEWDEDEEEFVPRHFLKGIRL